MLKGRAGAILLWDLQHSGAMNSTIPMWSSHRETRYAYQLSRGIGIHENLDGAVINNTLGSYTHLHPVASAGMFRHFVGLCRKNS